MDTSHPADPRNPCNPCNPRNPVILIHGINDTQSVFKRMAAALQDAGWEVHSLDLTPNNGDRPLNELAEQVRTYIDTTLGPSQPIDLVGFSMGGIVSRCYVQQLGGIERVQRFITLSSPHNGTLTAYGRWNPGVCQMRPNSPFLQQLNQDIAMLQRLNFTSIWTPLDLMIVPAHSSRLPIGREQRVNVWLHPWMLSDCRSIELVKAALQEPLRQSAVSVV